MRQSAMSYKPDQKASSMIEGDMTGIVDSYKHLHIEKD